MIANVINFFKNKKINLIEFNNKFDKSNYYYIQISNFTLYNLDKLKNLINEISKLKYDSSKFKNYIH